MTKPYDSSLCVSHWENNGYDDSDFGAVWWNGETFQSGIVGSTRYAGGTIPAAKADENLKAKYTAWREARLHVFRVERVRELLADPVPEREVIVIQSVTRGKNKIEAGAKGIVFWTGEKNNDPYGREWGKKWRVGIKVGDRKVYIDRDRVRVIGYEDSPLPLKNDIVQTAFAMSYPPAR